MVSGVTRGWAVAARLLSVDLWWAGLVMADRGGECTVLARRVRAVVDLLRLGGGSTSPTVDVGSSDEHAQVQAPPWLQQQVCLWPSNLGCRWMHLFGLMPQSHFTWADRDLRIVLQCAHCDTGRPFLLMCCSGRSECWQLLTRCPRTQASQAYFSPSISILIRRVGRRGYLKCEGRDIESQMLMRIESGDVTPQYQKLTVSSMILSGGVNENGRNTRQGRRIMATLSRSHPTFRVENMQVNHQSRAC